MIKSIFNLKEIVLDKIFWGIFLLVITTILSKNYYKSKDKFKRWNFDRKNKGTDASFSQKSIIGLAHASPVYKDEHIDIKITDIELYFSCPEASKEAILKENHRFEFREDKSFDGSNTFDDLVKKTKIEDLKSLIEKHKEIVAKSFLDKIENSKEIFNGKKFGVYSIKTSKIGDNEDAAVDIKLFKTDYYTHMVFRSIYKDLKEKKSRIAKVSGIEELVDFTPFTTSLGVNTYVLIDEGGRKGREILFVKRSKYVGSGEEKSKWHVSMNEGLSTTDITDPTDNNVCLKACVIRGLNEELGVDKKKAEINEIKFMDIFLEKNNFEIGITSYIDLKKDFEESKCDSAKDSKLEWVDKIRKKCEKEEIDKFVLENEGNFTDAGLYTLHMLKNRLDFLKNNDID